MYVSNLNAIINKPAVPPRSVEAPFVFKLELLPSLVVLAELGFRVSMLISGKIVNEDQ